jgi:hypothetical protein
MRVGVSWGRHGGRGERPHDFSSCSQPLYRRSINGSGVREGRPSGFLIRRSPPEQEVGRGDQPTTRNTSAPSRSERGGMKAAGLGYSEQAVVRCGLSRAVRSENTRCAYRTGTFATFTGDWFPRCELGVGASLTCRPPSPPHTLGRQEKDGMSRSRPYSLPIRLRRTIPAGLQCWSARASAGTGWRS